MGLGDFFSGAIGGGATGGALGGWPGAAIGAVGGGVLGYMNGNERDESAKRRKAGMDEAMKRLAEFSAQQRQQRQVDLDKIMSFYGPANQQLMNMYGTGGAVGMQPPAQPAAQPPGGMPFPLRPPVKAPGQY